MPLPTIWIGPVSPPNQALWSGLKRVLGHVRLRPERPQVEQRARRTHETGDITELGRALLEEVEPLVEVEFACLFLVDEDRRVASAVLGRIAGRELDWFPEVRIDLDNEPSGVATAVF